MDYDRIVDPSESRGGTDKANGGWLLTSQVNRCLDALKSDRVDLANSVLGLKGLAVAANRLNEDFNKTEDRLRVESALKIESLKKELNTRRETKRNADIKRQIEQLENSLQLNLFYLLLKLLGDLIYTRYKTVQE